MSEGRSCHPLTSHLSLMTLRGGERKWEGGGRGKEEEEEGKGEGKRGSIDSLPGRGNLGLRIT